MLSAGVCMQDFLRAACKALEAVDVLSHKSELGQELGHKTADKHLPEEMRARVPPPLRLCLALHPCHAWPRFRGCPGAITRPQAALQIALLMGA